MNIPLKQYARLLADYLKPQQRRVVWLTITLLGSIGLQLLNPQILGYFIDTAVAQTTSAHPPTLLIAALLFMAVALLTQILAVTATYLSENVAWTATNALRSDLIAHCLYLDLSFHKSHTPGELIERVDGDVTTLSRFFSQFTIYVLGNLLLLVGILIVLFYENWSAGLSLTLFALIALVILVRLNVYAVSPYAAYRQTSAEFFGFLGERLAATEDIRANGAVSYVMRRFYQILQRWLPVYHQARFASTILWGTSVGLFSLGNAIALATVAYLWNQNAITIGTAYLIFHYTNLLNQPIERIRQELEGLQQAEASILRIQELLQVQSKLQPSGNQRLSSSALSVSFENVWFGYERSLVIGHWSLVTGKSETNDEEQMTNNRQQRTNDKEQWTLQNLSFHLPAGQILGILGRTGSGKTTIARLLLRFYDPQSGSIRLGETALQQISSTELPQRIGFVTQDVQLFQASVRDNLTFFNPQISDTQILQTLDTLGLTGWLQTLQQGLDTLLGSDSDRLSTGQAQLLAFARVFLKKPGLVILDEATSRLDPITETFIEHAIDKLLEERTGIIIAHRLKTLNRADQILILENGQMMEYGDRQTLINNSNSRFAQLLKIGLTE